MRTVALGDVAQIHGGGRLKLSGKDFVGVGFPAYGAGGVNGYVEVAEYERDAVVLSAIGARCGKCFLASGQWTSLANTQVILPDPAMVDTTFLWYQLNDERRWPRSGTGQPFIRPADVKSHQVQLPSLDRQLEIVAELGAIDLARSLRLESIAAVETLEGSLFHQMFGSPEPSWPRVYLGDIAEVKGGKRLPKGAGYSPNPTNHPYVRVTDLRDGRIRLDDLVYLTPEVQAEISRYTVSTGDVVISIAGSIGLTASVPPQLAGANLTENAAKLIPKEEGIWQSGWLAQALRLDPDVRSQIEAHTGQVTIGKLALFRIEQIQLPLPPIELQGRYIERWEAVDRLRRQLVASDRDLNSLFEARRQQLLSA